MLLKNIETALNSYKKIDGIMIVRDDGIIEYSAILSEDHSHLETEPIIGMPLLEAYPSLTDETCTHIRVMNSGKPIINEVQTTIDYKGRKETLLTSTFPLKSNGRIVATVDISTSMYNDSPVKHEKHLYSLEDIVTSDIKMEEMKGKIRKLAPSESAVMIVGESGTGKQLVAESLHSLSNRCQNPFISLNCAAIPDTLLESTLFGTVKGSFTGAENKKGVFELANGGTLFLDEANSMSLELQAKLLKAVEDKCYYKVGGEKTISVDVRIISAMNIEPEQAIDSGMFRLDLFYRLGVVKLTIPPLRERKSDILLLIDYYISEYNLSMCRKVTGVSDIARSVLCRYSWPGNIRELKNAVEYAFNVGDDAIINLQDLPDNVVNSKEIFTTKTSDMVNVDDIEMEGITKVLNNYEKELIVKILEASPSLAKAAAKMKITRQSLKYKIIKYDIDYLALLTRLRN